MTNSVAVLPTIEKRKNNETIYNTRYLASSKEQHDKLWYFTKMAYYTIVKW